MPYKQTSREELVTLIADEIAQGYASLEANVDPADRGVGAYLGIRNGVINRYRRLYGDLVPSNDELNRRRIG